MIKGRAKESNSGKSSECQRCGHFWLSKNAGSSAKARSKVCPRCKSPYWDSLKKTCSICGKIGRSTHHIFPLTLWLHKDFDSVRRSSLRKFVVLLCSGCHHEIHKVTNQIIDIYWEESKKNTSAFDFYNAIEEDLILLLERVRGSNGNKFALCASEIQIERFSKYLNEERQMILKTSKKFDSWNTLLYKKDKTETERLLIEAVAMLSTEPSFSNMTPDEVYTKVCANTQGLFK